MDSQIIASKFCRHCRLYKPLTEFSENRHFRDGRYPLCKPCNVIMHTTHRRKTVGERFWHFVNKDGPVPQVRPELGNCWLWTGGSAEGYGRFYDGERKISAHHFLLNKAGIKVADGMHGDHLCRTTLCVRPTHIEVVTGSENVLRGFGPPAVNSRKIYCKNGHILEGDNLHPYWLNKGRRCCKVCKKAREAEWYKKNKKVHDARNKLWKADHPDSVRQMWSRSNRKRASVNQGIKASAIIGSDMNLYSE